MRVTQSRIHERFLNLPNDPDARQNKAILEHDLLMNYSPSIVFEHIEVAMMEERIAVFVVKDGQSAVLYDKTKGFPSAKLMASLVLLGSP